MNGLFVAARAMHYLSAMVPFGELAFVFVVAQYGTRGAPSFGALGAARISRVLGWSIAAGLVSGAVWFVVEAAVMSGMPLGSAINRETLGVVLHDTSFGRVWALRCALLAALCIVAVALPRTVTDSRRALLMAGALVAAAYLASIAWAGHAAAGQGGADDVEMVADVVHLLAAGAWLGALPALVDALRERCPDDVAARVAQRFSTVGVASVTALIASGIVNAWYQVGALPALFGTAYGRLLLLKLALFLAMIVVAVVNRGYLVPRLAVADTGARRSLRRNALFEIFIGMLIVVVVGRLGITVPAAHQQPLWPFAYTLSMAPMEQSAWTQLVVAGAAMTAFAATIVLLKGLLGRPPRARAGTLAALIVPAALCTTLLVVPAQPTTYFRSPVGYTTHAVAAGGAIYAASCESCHGRDGRGDGSATSSLALRPKDLAELVPERREGELYGSIAEGIAGTSMPGFAPRLSDVEIWNLIQFLDAQTAARNAEAMTDRLRPLRPVPAPDFAYQLEGRPQETLLTPIDPRVTLLVFFTLPQSASRLVDIAARLPAYAKAGARVIAVPMDREALAADDSDAVARAASKIVATVGPDVAVSYGEFAQSSAAAAGDPPAHVEYLIDRRGDLRVRWIGIPERPTDRDVPALALIGVLAREPLRPPQWAHRH